MKKSSFTPESQELDTVFGTRELTAEDAAAMQEFIAKTKNSPENQAAIAAMRRNSQAAALAAEHATPREATRSRPAGDRILHGRVSK